MSPLHVHGLDRFVDDVHAQFDAWAQLDGLEAALGCDGLAILRLAAHEWVANLVQHAQFSAPAQMTLSLAIVDDGVRCHIEDSSDGFDFIRQLDAQEAIFTEPEPSERGRGLLMLVSCTHDLAFREAGDEHTQRIAFTVRPIEDDGEDIFAPLFRAEDLVLDTAAPFSSSDDVDGRGDGASDLRQPAPISPDPLS